MEGTRICLCMLEVTDGVQHPSHALLTTTPVTAITGICPIQREDVTRRTLVTLAQGCQMFEAEMEMEKKQGGAFGPVLIIVVMVS